MVGKKTKDDQASCSILPQIAGVSPFIGRTRVNALNDCIIARGGGDIRTQQNLQMYMGDLLENPLLEYVVKKLDLKNADFEIDYAVEHPTLPLQGSMDGLAYADDVVVKHDPSNGIYVIGSDVARLEGSVVLECKITRDYAEDEPPLWRGVMQLQGLMDCVGTKFGILCVLYQSTDFRIFIYKRDEKMVGEIHDMVKDFDRRIREEDFYPPDHPNDALTIWNKINDEDQAVPLPDECEEHIKMVKLADITLKKWSEIKATSSAKLMSMLEDNEAGEYRSEKKGVETYYRVSWPMRHYKEQQARTIPAKQAYSVRLKTLKIKEVKNESHR